MGKIRVKALGDEEQEKKQEDEARKRAESKRAEKQVSALSSQSSDINNSDSKTEELKADGPASENRKPKTDNRKRKNTNKVSHSKKYGEKAALVDMAKLYKIAEALTLLPKVNLTSYDETVELHLNTTGSVSGAVTLPHGTGKQIRVAIADGANVKEVEELVKKIESGTIDFDVLVATPDSMPKLARVARVLGPRGLMPNPKNGTVTPKPQEVAKKFAGGQMNYKTEAKAPLLHMIVGKMSFGEKKLEENITIAIKAIQTKNVQSVTLKSTMSPGLKLDVSAL